MNLHPASRVRHMEYEVKLKIRNNLLSLMEKYMEIIIILFIQLSISRSQEFEGEFC
jgi:hypothetical protein